jgi:hypothetical protein
MNTLENSKVLCKTAKAIINETHVIDSLLELGKVEIIGSLRLEVMYRRDIDLFVLSNVIDKAQAQEITKKFIESGLFQTVGFADYQTFPEDDMPLGFYWELIVIKDGEKWKLDVWYLKPDEKYTHMVLDAINTFEPLLSTYPEKKETILKIKEAYFNGTKYKDNVKSLDIYKAVLEGGINSVEEFTVLRGLIDV